MKLKNIFSGKPRRRIIFLILLFFVVWSFLLFYISPTEITKIIGTNNSYILIFLFAFLGGSSILIPFPYYLFVVSFGASGLNPFIIGILGGVGLMLGDSTSYLLGYGGREILSKRFHKIFDKVCFWCNRKNKFVVFTSLFIYGAFIPIPNDVIVIPLGVARYAYWKIAVPLGLGNIVYVTCLALIGRYGLAYLLRL